MMRWSNPCTPATFPGRILFMSLRDDISSARDVSGDARKFHPGFWCCIGPGSEQAQKYNLLKLASIFAG